MPRPAPLARSAPSIPPGRTVQSVWLRGLLYWKSFGPSLAAAFTYFVANASASFLLHSFIGFFAPTSIFADHSAALSTTVVGHLSRWKFVRPSTTQRIQYFRFLLKVVVFATSSILPNITCFDSRSFSERATKPANRSRNFLTVVPMLSQPVLAGVYR